MRRSAVLLACSAAVLAAAPALADRLALVDGRIVDVPALVETATGYEARYETGRIQVPKELVRNAFIDAVDSYEPKNEFEKEQLAKGFVRFEDQWMSRTRMESIKRERLEERRKELEELEAHQNWKDAWTKETRHFTFRCNANPEILERYAELLEQYYTVFSKAWGITLEKPIARAKCEVSIYKDRGDFQQIGGGGPGVLGFFNFVEETLHVFYDRDDPAYAEAVLFHEANHLITHLIEPNFRYPSWVNESLAEYYGASKFDGKTVKLGGIQEGRLVALRDAQRDGKFVGLEELLRKPRFESLHYAEGWSFVHFLLSTPKYEKRFKRYFVDLGRSPRIKREVAPFADPRLPQKAVPIDEQLSQLCKYLGVRSLDELEKEWLEYVDQLEITTASGWAMAARFEMYSEDPDTTKAEEFIANALDQGLRDPAAYLLGAAIAMRNAEIELALERARKATEVDPFHASGWANVGFYTVASDPAGRRDEGLGYLRLACELEPDNDSFKRMLKEAQKIADLIDSAPTR